VTAMQTVLGQLNAVPGVVGTLVCGADGRLVANGFPSTHDPATLGEVARRLAEGAQGLGTIGGELRTLDLRHANARIVARPVAGAILLFLCAPSINLTPLEISAGIVASRLERLLAEPPSASAAPAPASPPAPASVGELHALVQRIDAAIARRRLDPFATRGEIALRAGFGLGFIDAATPDDPKKLARLTAAASAVLGDVP
jgi:predicted regulator of Ras-like GTPase activity (Roadblock/LC7/MglB family)